MLPTISEMRQYFVVLSKLAFWRKRMTNSAKNSSRKFYCKQAPLSAAESKIILMEVRHFYSVGYSIQVNNFRFKISTCR